MKIKFFLEENKGADKANYAIECILAAQGLRKLGIPFYANIANWNDPFEQQYLFNPAPADFDADVHIYHGSSYFLRHPERLKEVDFTKINLDIDDGEGLVPYWQKPEYQQFSQFDLILATHQNRNQHYPPYKIAPWQLGFTETTMRYIEQTLDEQVEDVVLDTFRLHHNLRQLAIEQLGKGLADKYPTKRFISDQINDKDVSLPEADRIYWQLTGRRHNPAYYRQLNASLLTYVFGGFYHPLPATHGGLSKVARQFYKVRSKLQQGLGMDNASNYYIYQWDSYRLWEALLSKTCPIFLDMDDWGFQLPVMPINGKHYIGVHGFDFADTAKRIKSMGKDKIAEIGWEGRQWVLENYGPQATAKRLLGHIEQIQQRVNGGKP